MTHVLKNIAHHWQILVHFGSFAMSIWRLLLGQFWHKKGKMQMDGQNVNTQEPMLGPLNDNEMVKHMWDISGAVAEPKQHRQIWSKTW